MLTEEHENIIKLLVQGKTNEQVADAVGYSISTLKNRLRTIYGYYKVENKIGLLLCLMNKSEE